MSTTYCEIGRYWWWNTIGPAALQETRPRVGGIRMGRLEKYRRFAQECVEMARTTKNPQTQAVLLHMAEVWFRLAEERIPDAAEKIAD